MIYFKHRRGEIGNQMCWKSVHKSYAGGTGGEPPKVIELTELQESLLQIIDPEAAGLEGIPEGGNFNRTIQRELTTFTNNRIVKRGFSYTYDELCEAIEQEVELKEQFPSIQMKKVCVYVCVCIEFVY